MFAFNKLIICLLHELNNWPMREAIKHGMETIKGEMAQVIYCIERIKMPRP